MGKFQFTHRERWNFLPCVNLPLYINSDAISKGLCHSEVEFQHKDLTSVTLESYIHEGSIDVIGALSVDGDQKGEAAVRRQDVHAPVLLVVPRQ